ncbi:MAG TPA: DinB family protein [Gemmatimonadales bacterium]|nr:DinB family protein [Gemmatimonadales bacterium]
MTSRTFALALLAATALPSAAFGQHDHHAGGGVDAVRPLYERLRTLYIKSAELMPEADYSFRPAEKVRTYGEVLGHVANEHYLFCSSALGQENPNKTDFEKVGKAALIEGLKASFAYCDPAYRMDEARAMEETTFFDSKGSRLWVLIFNATHDSEHYGNIVTYLRIKGLVPPSSQGGQ